jgi:hypothetical protein
MSTATASGQSAGTAAHEELLVRIAIGFTATALSTGTAITLRVG